MKAPSTLLVVLLLISTITPLTASGAVGSGVSYVQLRSVQFIGYTPAQLQIVFPHTTTVDSNVSSLSGGRYTYSEVTSSPYSTMTFSLNASDIYTIYFVLHYPVPESGNLSWTLLSPGFLPQTGSSFINNSDTIALTFVAELLNQELYPTADQIANATAAILINKLIQQNAQQEQEIAAIRASQTYQNELDTALITVSLVVSIVAIILARRFTAPH